MKLVRNVKDFLLENKLEINVYINSVNIVNYKELGHFDNNKVIIYHDNGVIKVMGDNLVVSRLMNSEVLITGHIKQIDLG